MPIRNVTSLSNDRKPCYRCGNLLDVNTMTQVTYVYAEGPPEKTRQGWACAPCRAEATNRKELR